MAAEQQRPGQETESKSIIIEPTQRFSQNVLERNIHDQDTFKTKYQRTTAWQAKYDIAHALIQDGRYEDQLSLLRDFVPPRAVSSRFDSKGKKIVEEDVKSNEPLIKELKNSLTLLLLERGKIRPDSPEANQAEETLEEQYEQHEDIKELALAGVPIEVVGQIMTLELFSNVSDQRKLEELRGWVTRSLYRPYLGMLKGKSPEKELSVVDVMDRIPKNIFKNPYMVKYNIVQKWIERKFMRHITDAGLEQGMIEIENMVQGVTDVGEKEFMETMYERFCEIATEPFREDRFNKVIEIKPGQWRNFPSFEQRAFTYDAKHYDTRLLAADTGLGKTNAFFHVSENMDAKRVLVLAPAGGKETWQIEAKKVFKDPDQVYLIEGAVDLEKAAAASCKYVVISHQLLGDAEGNPRLQQSLETFIKAGRFDGAGIDEIDNFSNPDAVSTKVAHRLLEGVRENYQAQHENSNAPIFGLTATPFRGNMRDPNVPMAMLYPDDFAATISEATATKKTYSDTCLNRPDLGYLIFVGERKMFRWEEATGVQELKFEPLEIDASSFEEYLYSFIAEEVGTGTLNKIRLLEDALLNPLLVKAEVRQIAGDKIPEIDIDAVMEMLKKTVFEWKQLRNIDNPTKDEDYLNVDRLVELGMGDVVLGCFFSDLLENGVDTLVEELTRDSTDESLIELREFWQKREISTMYQALRGLLENAVTVHYQEDGTPAKKKFFAVSPARRQGRTGQVLQRDIKTTDGTTQQLYRDYELGAINDTNLLKHIREWMKALGAGEPEFIDGTVPVGKQRNQKIKRYVEDANVPGLVSTLEATYQSRDYTITDLIDDNGVLIDEVSKIFLGPPWYFQQLRQMIGRSRRQGQLVPVTNTILMVRGLIHAGKMDNVYRTYLMDRVALSGIPFSPEEQEFYDSTRVGNRIAFQTPDARFLRDVLGSVSGAGEEEVLRFMQDTERGQEKSNFERFAERFYDEGNDRYKLTGYNAELVASIIKKVGLTDSSILSIGAGTLLLQRVLEKGIDNLDINPYIMDVAWEEASRFGGRKLVGRASNLEEAGIAKNSKQFIDAAFLLHWTKLNGAIQSSERVKVLTEMHDTLSENGTLCITVPEKALDESLFKKFTTALENNFGLKVDYSLSGQSYGISKMGHAKRIGWCITAQKTKPVDLSSLHLEDLSFLYDSREWISTNKKQNGKGVAKGDYPTPKLRLEFARYEIINPEGITSVAVDSAPREEVVTINPTLPTEAAQPAIEEEEPSTVIFDENLQILRGATEEEFNGYRHDFVRTMRKITGWSWQEIEDFSREKLRELKEKGLDTNNRLALFAYLLKEAKQSLEN